MSRSDAINGTPPDAPSAQERLSWPTAFTAKLIGCDKRTLIESKIPRVRIGRRYYWPRAAVLDWLRENAGFPQK